jgi:hypothetical protein
VTLFARVCVDAVMPWKEMSPMTERVKFVAAMLEGEESFTELCERFGISGATSGRNATSKAVSRASPSGQGPRFRIPMRPALTSLSSLSTRERCIRPGAHFSFEPESAAARCVSSVLVVLRVRRRSGTAFIRRVPGPRAAIARK